MFAQPFRSAPRPQTTIFFAAHWLRRAGRPHRPAFDRVTTIWATLIRNLQLGLENAQNLALMLQMQ